MTPPRESGTGCRGWDLTLADGRRFSWNEWDGVRSEGEARAKLLAQEGDVEIVDVEEIGIVSSVYLSEN